MSEGLQLLKFLII